MTRVDILAEIREVVSDQVAPYAWSDNLLMGYAAEGQDKFCEKTGFFRDFTNYTITTVAGEQNYALSGEVDPRIIEVLEVWRETSKLVEGVDWVADLQSHTLTLLVPPEEGVELRLKVWRYAQVPFDHKTDEGFDAEPEIPTRFHRALVEYAAYKAFMHHDQEKQDKVKAGDHLAAFNDYCSDGGVAFRRIIGDKITAEPSQLYNFP